MAPKLIVILRHAEKPDRSAPHLAIRGKMRAEGLRHLLPRLVSPDFVFASTSTKNSKRPYQTIRPAAKAFGLKVNTGFADREAKRLAKALRKRKYEGKTVLICWHHGQMPKLIRALGFRPPYDKWPPDLFDRIIALHPRGDRLQNLPQRLLFGDSGSDSDDVVSFLGG